MQKMKTVFVCVRNQPVFVFSPLSFVEVLFLDCKFELLFSLSLRSGNPCLQAREEAPNGEIFRSNDEETATFKWR